MPDLDLEGLVKNLHTEGLSLTNLPANTGPWSPQKFIYRKLRKKGKSAEADELAVKINGLICEYRKKCLANLSEATPKELWAC